ncbi:MAG: hypothetical protein E7399_07505 [Ruminococcaceae bacterium]|nr:hypothetical protein [Oscillospiraceae bacterium]
MSTHYDKADLFAWMPLIGFDKNLPDKGVSKLMNRIQHTLDGVCLLLAHPDIIHQHEGMEEERVLPPDNCSYYARPYNEEQQRQEWTNHELKDLVQRLTNQGTECFVSIFGITLNHLFHQEWIYDHPELLFQNRNFTSQLHVLKRFRDGTYYEDFFADQICRVMEDYGFSGLHVADSFCPQIGVIKNGDFSIDMLEQFMEHTKIQLPQEIITDRIDSTELNAARADWIWEHYRADWIEFLCWRWEAFWKKICDRLHAIGKKVFVLGMYCSDPFDTVYCNGIDLRGIVNAGVDYLMPNMAANSCSIGRNRHWPYYQWANMIPLTDSYADQAKKYNMLAVKDATEEWDMIHHAPTFLDRDIGFLASYLRYQKDGSLKRCLDGHNICLADGVGEQEWHWLLERFDIGFGKMPVASLAPTFVWSDTVQKQMLREYITHRRWTPHKFLSELNWAGVHTGATVRCEDLTNQCGNLFVPDFDLLSEQEKQQLAAYKGGGVICTSAEDFCPEQYEIQPVFQVIDHDTPFRNKLFVYGMEIENKEELADLAAKTDDAPILEDPFHAPDSNHTLKDTMPYQKVSKGFLKVLCKLMVLPFAHLFESTHPVIPMVMEDGAIRLYLLNDDRLHYADAVIKTKQPIKEVKNISKFPLLPVRFSENGTFNFMSSHHPGNCRCFRVPIPQAGLGIVDLYLEDD